METSSVSFQLSQADKPGLSHRSSPHVRNDHQYRHPILARIGAFVFDLDGVMVDTEPISRRAWHIVLKDFDLDLDEETYHGIIGRRSDESAQIIKSSLGLSLDASELVRRKKKVFNRLLYREWRTAISGYWLPTVIRAAVMTWRSRTPIMADLEPGSPKQ